MIFKPKNAGNLHFQRIAKKDKIKLRLLDRGELRSDEFLRVFKNFLTFRTI